MEEQSPRQQRIELFATMMLALAGLATAWSTHQATRWSGEAVDTLRPDV
jgi:hypothetical protein